MSVIAQLHATHQVSYRLGALRNGVIVNETKLRPHMLTDAGLDKLGSTYALEMLRYCILGTNPTPTPVRRDDGAVTFTQTGNVITASSPFFVSSDTGRLFKWGAGSSGNEVYITNYSSPTAVEVGTSASVAASVGTVWYVNTAALLSPIAGLTWTKQATGNSSIVTTDGSSAVVTHTTINIGSAVAAPATITELAISDSTANSGVFDRDVVSPPVALLAGDQPVVTIEYIARYSPITPVAVGNVATGYDSSGTLQLETLVTNYSGIKTLSDNGSISTAGYLEPSGVSNIGVATATFTQQPFSPSALYGSTGVVVGMSNAAYGAGSHFRDSSATFSIGQANATIHGVFLVTTNFEPYRSVSQKFTTPFVKNNTQTLSFTFRKSWSRVLIN